MLNDSGNRQSIRDVSCPIHLSQYQRHHQYVSVKITYFKITHEILDHTLRILLCVSYHWITIGFYYINVVAQVVSAAQVLHDTYISTSAPSMVNINSTNRSAVLFRIADPLLIGADLFDDTQTEIYKLLESDSFPRFKKSTFWQSFLTQKFLWDWHVLLQAVIVTSVTLHKVLNGYV